MQKYSEKLWYKKVIELFVIALLYFGMACLGHLTALPSGIEHTIYPAMGFAIAVIFLRGYAVWTGVFLGAMLSALSVYFDLTVSAAIIPSLISSVLYAVATTASACGAVFIMHRLFKSKTPFLCTLDMVMFIVCAALISTAVATSMGVYALVWTGFISRHVFSTYWSVLWIGNVIGVLLITPLLLSFKSSTMSFKRPYQIIQTIVLYIMLIATFHILFNGWFFHGISVFPITLLLLLILLGVVFKLDLFGVCMALCLVSLLSIWSMDETQGPFYSESKTNVLLYLQCFIAVMTTTVLIFKAMLDERNRAQTNFQLSQQRYQLLVENLHIGIALIGADRKILMINKTLADWLGHPADAFIGKNCFCEIQSITKPCSLCPTSYNIRTHTPVEFESHIRDINGHERMVRIQILPLPDKSTGEMRFIETIVDITARKKAEADIRLLSSAVKQSNEGIAVTDMEGRLIFVNDAFANMHNYISDKLLTKDISSLRMDTDEFSKLAFDETMASSKAFSGEVYHIRSDNTTFPCFEQVTQFTDETGTIIGTISSIRDITDLHEAEEALKESELRFRQAFEYASLGIMLVCQDKSILQTNIALSNMLGLEEKDVSSHKLHDIILGEYHGHVDTLLSDLLAGKQSYGWIEIQCRHTNGESVWTLFCASIIRDMRGNPLYYVVQLENISERKKYERELQLHHDQLEKLVEQRTQELNHSNEQLREFASTVAHDLQSPIRSLTGFCDLLKKEYEAHFDEQGEFYITRIIDSAYRMERLIKDLLQYSRVSHNQPLLESVDLNTIVEYVMTDLDADIHENKCSIKFDNLMTIQADKVLVTQLFQNLIGNSLKYRRQDIEPIISIATRLVTDDKTIDSDDKTKNWCEVIYSDNGIGFEQEYAETIFEPFKRLHTQAEYAGTGLGLSTCKKIVDRHRGTISASGQPGKGAIFTIRFPIDNDIAKTLDHGLARS